MQKKGRKILCAHYLFNQWLEFDQTSKFKMHHHEGVKKWLDFGDLE